jgi:hypothetical protein
MIRIAKRIAEDPNDLYLGMSLHSTSSLVYFDSFFCSAIEQNVAGNLWNKTKKDRLHAVMEQVGIQQPMQGTEVRSTKATSPNAAKSVEDSYLIPNVLFFKVPHQERILRHMEKGKRKKKKQLPFSLTSKLPSFSLSSFYPTTAFNEGSHLLLIGSQGTGKNKIADHFLQQNGVQKNHFSFFFFPSDFFCVIELPRQYVQLHRDTTVQSLTVVPSLVLGQVIHQPTPLMVAIEKG